MRTMLAGAALAAALCVSATAGAQDGYADHYRAYQAASEANDADAKLRSGEAAWRAAEAELGATETTALLAQNHLYDRLFRDPEGSIEVAARALALGEQGLALTNISLTELRAADAYARAASAPKDEDLRAGLAAALAADRATGSPLNPLIIGLYRSGAVLATKDEDYGGAYDFAAALTDELRAAPEAPPSLLAGALIDEAATLMAGRKPLPRSSLGTLLRPRRTRYSEQMSDAAILLAEAVSLFPAPGPIDDMDPVLARAQAWMAVNDALLISTGSKMRSDHEYQGRTLADFAREPSESFGTSDTSEASDGPACDVEWSNRRMRYPRIDRKWYAGAVYVGYHIGDDGRLEGARVLSEVPAGRFGPAVLDAMEKWKAETDGLPADCRRDKTAVIKFIVN